MPSISITRASNAAWKPAYVPVIVVFGGTSGIGEAVVKLFAKLTEGKVRIVVVGRNEAAATQIIAGLPRPTADAIGAGYSFVRCDVTVMREVHDFATTLKNDHGISKINYLVLSAGVFGLGGRVETVDGLDVKLASRFYSRFALIQDLVPLLQAAEARSGEDVGVLTILGAGQFPPKIDFDDLGMTQGYGGWKAMTTSMAYNDLMVQAFAERYPTISFTHVYPGPVDSGILYFSTYPKRLLNIFTKYVFRPFIWILTYTTADCAERMVHALLDGKGGGMKRRGELGDDIGMLNFPDVTEEEKKLFWDHCVEAVKGRTGE